MKSEKERLKQLQEWLGDSLDEKDARNFDSEIVGDTLIVATLNDHGRVRLDSFDWCESKEWYTNICCLVSIRQLKQAAFAVGSRANGMRRVRC